MKKKDPPKYVTIAEAAHLGGKATLEKYGREHYQNMRKLSKANAGKRKAKKPNAS